MKNYSVSRLLPVLLFMLVACNPERTSRPDGQITPTPTPAGPKTYYIAPEGNDQNNGTSSAFALKSFDQAIAKLKPGDVLNVMPGTYVSEGRPIIEMKSVNSGSEGKPITIKAGDPSARPVLKVGGTGAWNAVVINASWVVIDGLELCGWNQQLDSLAARKNAEVYRDNRESIDWNATAKFNTNGISIGDKSQLTTHVTVRNCVVHDFPGGGLGATTSDYITFENNVVYNNAWFNMYACSGISVIHPVNSDQSTSHKIIVRGNLVYNNRCMIPWATTADFRLSDGNGIIMDINQYGDSGGRYASEVYKGRTLVANNVSIFNGGSGIHSFKADHVDIVNNTAYWNGRKYPDNNYNEIFGHNCKDVNITNNIMIARKGGYCNNKAEGPVYSHNLYFGDVQKMGTGDIKGDPLVVNLSRDGAVADMHLKAGSPAIGKGINADYVPKTDKDDKARGESIDIGAYQFVK
ncbi:MAG: right-handed parallel beta-helix repeat-containing protein [Bacteroidales bacterium]|nr:right-handed parallel beta-helix repeat-containing protein [Bacteroidales bacterium]